MAKLILLFPLYAIKSLLTMKPDDFQMENFNQEKGVFSPWHFFKKTKIYLVMEIAYLALTIALLVLGIFIGIAGFIIGGLFALVAVFGGTTMIVGNNNLKKYFLSEELFNYTISVDQALAEYRRCVDYLQVKFSLPDVSNKSGYFAFANTIYQEFFAMKELGVYEIKHQEFLKMLNSTQANFEGYVKRTLTVIMTRPQQYEKGFSFVTVDELKIDDISRNYPELEEMHNELEKACKKYQSQLLYLFEEDQSLCHNLEVIERMKTNSVMDAFADEKKYADKGIFVGLYNEYKECCEYVKSEIARADEEYRKTIKTRISKVLKNLEIEPSFEGEEVKRPLVFTTKNQYLEKINDAMYKKEAVEGRIRDNIDRVEQVTNRLDERINFFRKSNTVAEVDFFETLLNTCDIDDINTKVTRIFQILRRLRQQAMEFNAMLDEIKDIIKEEVYSTEEVTADTLTKKIQQYIDAKIDVRTFISDLNVQLQIDDIKRRLYNDPIYLYNVYIVNDDVEAVMKSAVRGYKYDGFDRKKNSVLHLCAKQNAVKCYDYFIKRLEGHLTKVNADGECPIDIAKRNSDEIFKKIEAATIVNKEHQFKYRNYQIQSVISNTDIMDNILQALVDFAESTVRSRRRRNEDDGPFVRQLDMYNEIKEAYLTFGPNGIKNKIKIKDFQEIYNNNVNIASDAAEGAVRFIGNMRKYEAYYDKKLLDIFESDVADAIAYLDFDRIQKMEAVLRHYLAANKSAYVTSLFKTEYAQNDLMLSTDMHYIERMMIGLYSSQNILILYTGDQRNDNLIDIVIDLKNDYYARLEKLYEEQPNRYAYHMLAEEDPEFGASHSENDIYYKALGLTRTATLPEIKKAYKRQILANHKDRGGDESKIMLINDAYAKLLLEKED